MNIIMFVTGFFLWLVAVGSADDAISNNTGSRAVYVTVSAISAICAVTLVVTALVNVY